MKLRDLCLLCFMLGLCSTAQAGPTRSFVLDNQSSLGEGKLDGTAIESDGTIQAGVQTRRTELTGVPTVKCLLTLADGSAYAGDPFGSTVIAGHLDSRSGAKGFFARLERIKIGDVITLRSPDHRLSYRVFSRQEVARRALADDSRAFDQNGSHRLVLITCTGDYLRDRGGYQYNLVITAKPIGLAK